MQFMRFNNINLKIIYCLLLVILTSVTCNKIDQVNGPDKTLSYTGIVHQNYNGDYLIKISQSGIPMCPVKILNDNLWEWNALPEEFKVDGLPVKFVAKVIPPPSEVRLNVVLVELLSIERITFQHSA